MRKQVYLILCSGLLTASLQAQPVVQQGEVPMAFDASQARFEHLTVADGLPENSAVALLQDHLGFIWIGTQNGLARYDGLTMTTFQEDPDDPYSFRGSMIFTMLEDRGGDLWIGTWKAGLIHYDRTTGRFTSYPADPDGVAGPSNSLVSFLHEDQRGDLWVVSGTFPFFLDRFNRATSTFTRFRHDPTDPGSLSSNMIGTFSMPARFYAAFYEDRSGTIWVGTMGGGLNRFDPETETFKHYKHDSGDPASLSNNDVRGITEDRNGQLWVSTTEGGLNRFDPQTETFTYFRHAPSDSTSLASDEVYGVYEDQRGALWVTTRGGLHRFDPQTETFTRYPPDENEVGSPRHDYLYAVHEDEAGIWFMSRNSGAGEGGYHYYDRATDSFTFLFNDPEDPESLSRFAFNFLKDRSGTVWIGSGMQGVNKLDHSPRFPLYTHDPGNPDSPSSNRITFFYEAPSEPNVLWVGSEAGLDRWDRTTGRYTHYQHDPGDPQSLAPGWVTSILEDRAGRFWVTTWGGLHLMDRENGRFTRFVHNPADPNSLAQRQVNGVTETGNGALWIALDSGLNRFDPETETFTYYSATADTSYHPDLYKVIDAHETDGRRVAALLQVGDNADLTQEVAFEEPAQVLMVAMGECTTQCLDYGWIENAAGEVVWEMSTKDSRHAGGGAKNRIQGALLHFEPGTYRLRYRTDDSHAYGTWNEHLPDRPADWGIQALQVSQAEADTLARLLRKIDEHRLLDNSVGLLYEDREGVLWISTTKGLNRYEPTIDGFTTYVNGPEDLIWAFAFHEDQAGRLWIGDFQRGLHLISREREYVRRYTIHDGLPSNIVRSILEDDEGRLWLATGKGLARFDPETETFRTYGASYGLQPEALMGGALKSVDGMFFFGGHGGINAVYPSRIADDPTPPEVAFSGFDLFNAPAAVGPKAPLQEDISMAEQISLAHNQNDFTFHFAALHYARPEENTVAYRLEPYEEDWVTAGMARSARYTNLSPGSYTFRVKAANPDGVWNEEGTSISVVISPPWWQTTWAYVLYGVLFLGSIVAVDRLQRRRLLQKERERTMQRELAQKLEIEKAHADLQQAHTTLKTTQAQLIQSEKMASLGSLTAGIAHEIKNPLNFVNNFAELNEELTDEIFEDLEQNPDLRVADVQDVLDDIKTNAGQIAKHGKRADGIVHSMMEHARGTEGERQEVDINAFVEEYFNLAYHGMRAKKANFNATLKRDYDKSLGTVSLVPSEMGRVLINLLNNAFYVVHEKAQSVNGDYEPTVTVSTKAGAGQVAFRVTDNGAGIRADVQEKIFEPFFTTKPTGQGNTGLGLSLSYDIVTQGHNGTMKVESEEGQGATFIITLPL